MAKVKKGDWRIYRSDGHFFRKFENGMAVWSKVQVLVFRSRTKNLATGILERVKKFYGPVVSEDWRIKLTQA